MNDNASVGVIVSRRFREVTVSGTLGLLPTGMPEKLDGKPGTLRNLTGLAIPVGCRY